LRFLLLILLTLSFSLKAFPNKKRENRADSILQLVRQSQGAKKLTHIIHFCEAENATLPKKVNTLGNQGMKLALELKDTSAMIELSKMLALAQTRIGKLDSARINIALNTRLAFLKDDTLEMSWSFLCHGFYHHMTGQYDSSIFYYKKSYEKGRSAGSDAMTFGPLNNIALIYSEFGDFKNALLMYDSIGLLCKNSAFDCEYFLLNRGSVLLELGEPSKALEDFFNVRKIYVGDNGFLVASADHLIGKTLATYGLNQEALKYFSSVYDYFQVNGNIKQIPLTMESIGHLMLQLNKPIDGEYYFKKALAFKKKHNQPNLTPSLLGLGILELDRDNNSEAHIYFNKAYANSTALKDSISLIKCLNYQSQALLRLGKISKAKKLIQLAIQIQSDKDKNWGQRGLIDLYETYYSILIKQDQAKEALKYKELIDQLKTKYKDPEQIIDVTKKAVIHALQINEAKQKDILPINKLEIESNKRQIHILYVILSVLIFLLVGIYLYFKYFLKRKKNKSNINYVKQNEAKDLIERLNQNMKIEQSFMDEDLTLAGLAEQISTSEKKLSVVLNIYLKTTFYDFINAHRVRIFKEELLKEKNQNYSLIGIALNCGFKSKSSFYRAFKKETGMPPSAFKKQQ